MALPPPLPYTPTYPEVSPLVASSPLSARSDDAFDPYQTSYGLSSMPRLPHTDTGLTAVEEHVDPSDHTIKHLEKIEETPRSFPQPYHFTPPPGTAGTPSPQVYVPPPPPDAPILSRRRNDRLLFAGIVAMIVWPWALFAALRALGGVQLYPNRSARWVMENPHPVSFIVTLIGSVVRLICGLLFSFSIVRFGQEFIAMNNPHVTVFDVSLLSAFRNQNWVWGLDETKHIFVRNRLIPIILVGMCVVGFALVPSGTASLIAPGTFNKTATLLASELNFAPGDVECTSWLDRTWVGNNCDWKAYKGMQYTTCLSENQMVDVLESGRGSMLALLSNNTGTSSMSQLGAKDGLRFLGPIRGVLPIGPDGVPAFDTTVSSPNNPFSVERKKEGMVSYNYTLEQQGLNSEVSCIYDSVSPIRFGPVPDSATLVLQYNGTCDSALGLQPILGNVLTYSTLNSNNSLGYWACKAPSSGLDTVGGQDPSYFVYLRGRAFYKNAIGNITCTVSPIRPDVFRTTFLSRPGYFTTTEVPLSPAEPGSDGRISATYPGFIEHVLVGLGNVVWEAQNWQSNLVAESVITLGVKSRGLSAYQPNEVYLRLYEGMIQGILEYEATYSRLIYSTAPDAPKSCIREIRGEVSYEVVGWYASYDQAGFMVPMTLVNLASLAVLVAAIVIGEGEYDFDPTDTRPLLSALVEHGDGSGPTTVQWTDEVRYSQVPLGPGRMIHR